MPTATFFALPAARRARLVDEAIVEFAERPFAEASLSRIARRTAIGLAALGVAQGDKVLSWLPNGPDAIRVWFGLNYLGAVYVPINLAYRGGLLAHVVANSDARLIVAHADLLGRLADIDRAALATAVVLGDTAPAVSGLVVHPPAALAPGDTIVTIGAGGGVPLKLDGGGRVRDPRSEAADYTAP